MNLSGQYDAGLNNELSDLIVEQDLSIKELTEDFCNIVIEYFGTHNYKCVIDIVNQKLNK